MDLQAIISFASIASLIFEQWARSVQISRLVSSALTEPAQDPTIIGRSQSHSRLKIGAGAPARSELRLASTGRSGNCSQRRTIKPATGLSTDLECPKGVRVPLCSLFGLVGLDFVSRLAFLYSLFLIFGTELPVSGDEHDVGYLNSDGNIALFLK